MKGLSRKLSLRWLLSGSLLLILLGTTLALGVGVYFLVARHLYFSGIQRLVTETFAGMQRSVDEEDEPRPPLHAPDDLRARASEIAANIGTRRVLARVLTPNGRVLGESQMRGPTPAVDRAMVERLVETYAPPQAAGRPERRMPGVPYFDQVKGQRWLVMLVPLSRENRLAGVVYVATSYRESDNTLRALAWYLVAGVALAVVIGLVVSLALAGAITRPLQRLVDATRRVAAGDMSGRAALGPGRNEVYVVAAAFDDMVERLQGVFEAQRRFVADASHELKTPLTAIGGMAEMLRTGADQGVPDKRERALATIEREVDKMSLLVADLLTLSRAEAAEASLPVAELDLKPLLQEAVLGVAPTGHAFETRFEEGLRVEAHASLLSRAVQNLLDNAFKYTPAGGHVQLSSRREGRQAVIEVRDDGTGIASEDLPRIFDRFYRVDASRTRRTGGSGLGLAIVRAIVQRHGGSVDVESAPGQGTAVRIRLPLFIQSSGKSG